MIKDLKYSGKLVLSYETHSEQLAIDELDRIPIEDVLLFLDEYDARNEAIAKPWMSEEKETK